MGTKRKLDPWQERWAAWNSEGGVEERLAMALHALGGLAPEDFAADVSTDPAASHGATRLRSGAKAPSAHPSMKRVNSTDSEP